MALSRRRMLGLMLGGRSVTAAELRVGSGERAALHSLTRLELPAELTWDEPAKIGAALADRLAEAGVPAKHAVLGLPAAWMLTRSLSVPPADGEALRRVVATKAERAFANGGKDLTVDFVASGGSVGAAPAAQGAVLLVAAQRERVAAAVAMAEAAGLRVDAVTATAAVVAMCQAGSEEAAAGRSLTLMVGEEACELAVHSGDGLETIRPLRKLDTAEADAGAVLAAQLRQFRVLARGNGADAPLADRAGTDAEGGGDRAVGVWLWDAVGLDTQARRKVAAEAGASTVREGDLERWVRTNGTVAALGEPCAVGRYAGAVALAAAGVERERLAIDWLHPRLAEPPRRLLSRAAQIAVTAAMLVLAVAIGVTLHYRAAAAEVAELEAQLATMQEDIAAARLVVQRVDHAEAWFADRASPLAGLEAMTAAFGEDGSVWATELNMADDLTGTVAGHATAGQQVLELRDRMQASPFFTNVALLYMREAERAAADAQLAWAISFAFVREPSEPLPSESQP